MPRIEPLEQLLDELVAERDWSYHKQGPLSTEPAALAALAIMGSGRLAEARPVLDWLVELQTSDGSVGVTATQATPTWPTSLAVVAWNHFCKVATDSSTAANTYQNAAARGCDFLLTQAGTAIPNNPQTGHDTTIVGWSWAAATHSWIEPTAMNVWALKSSGKSEHMRTREAVRLLLNRQIPGGGCNYGNTFVLQQKLIPHFQPTAISLLALQGEADQGDAKPATAKPATAETAPAETAPGATSGDMVDAFQNRREMSLAFLARQWPNVVGTASTCYAAMALAAYGRSPNDVGRRLTTLHERRRASTGTYPLALIALAAQGGEGPLAQLTPLASADSPDETRLGTEVTS